MAAGVELAGAWNFRDVAETPGLEVRPGRLLRSSELSRLANAGRALLGELGVADIADLRSPREVARHGVDLPSDRMQIHQLPFLEISAGDGDSPHESALAKLTNYSGADRTAAGARFMTAEYRRFAGLAGARAAVSRIIGLLAQGRPVLTHCFAGKDRTGFTVAVVLEAAGVGPDAIMADYLRSNAATPQLRAMVHQSLVDRTASEESVQALLSEELLGVREGYLTAARDAVDEIYGSLTGYLRAAGVTESEVDALRAALRR